MCVCVCVCVCVVWGDCNYCTVRFFLNRCLSFFDAWGVWGGTPANIPSAQLLQ